MPRGRVGIGPLLLGIASLASCLEPQDGVSGSIDAAYPPTWQLEDSPTVRLGKWDTDVDAQVFTVPIGSTLLPGDAIAVADFGTSQIRAFDTWGNARWTAGGMGGGPGEFPARVGAVFGTPDTLVVSIGALTRRVNVFGPEGELEHSYDLELDPEWDHAAAGALTGGLLVLRSEDRPWGEHPHWGITRPTRTRVSLFSPDGTQLAQVGPFRGARVQVGSGDEGFRAMQLPFDQTVIVGAGADRWFVGLPDEGLIRVYGPEGRLVTEFPMPAGRVLSAVDLARVSRRYGRTFTEQLPQSDSAPGVVLAGVDLAGRIWLGAYRDADEPRRRWVVVGESGVRMAELVLTGAEPKAFGENALLLHERGKYSETQVVKYRILR